jgi:hypothetical protein
MKRFKHIPWPTTTDVKLKKLEQELNDLKLE